ncbi:hypothetical protein GCM10007860_04180 [Chitiniphilus shinanonensis]|uniref:DUF2863 family protein n=1 Tax=Chitiniphilus shinanonensis TaxID=553088 RepID=A0ABQ6BQ19_9NEIS|nr:DUF2863 family protein [Chitiniphilus shinanonensis]GLS03275.1 hypothetical protein GCM10007860_04180 [Chitiniphilus shinanonensis]
MIKRNRPSRRGRSTANEADLVRLAEGMADSSSRLEDGFWAARLSAAVARLIAERDEDTLNAALDQLSQHDPDAYNALADAVEGACESARIERNGAAWDVLLFTAPVLAWSRWQIPSEGIGADALRNLRVQLGAHVLARDVKVALADYLFSPDQLPRGFVPTAELTQALAEAAFGDGSLKVAVRELPETKQFLSDTRYLIGAALVPAGGAIFRWQEEDGDREEAFKQWTKQGGAALQPLLPGCAVEPCMPGAYHAAWREADRESRAYSLRATVTFLMLSLNLDARQLQAAIAPFVGRRLEEYRVGFVKAGSDQVLHGVVWPLLDGEDENTDIVGDIEAVLKELGVTEIRVHEHDFPLDYCDDCGSPLYPNPDGDVLHAELPEEEAPEQPRHLH